MEAKMKQRNNPNSKFGKKYNAYWTSIDNAKSDNYIEELKRHTRENVVQNTSRLMTATASDIAGPSTEVVFESKGCRSESVEFDSVKLDDTTNLCIHKVL
ncbi:hypothetical protein INT47_004740 [Mucor saturninus]|uniref:Uncharacterized protein n=1 Tax=Mucor saturninus TaxID=64648 RepID=A0A8H7QFZ3_9FUNG|nr:hypothetical protein INT47_004740 [Mucor saturninus]